MTQFVGLVTDKKFLTGSSALAFALGMGTVPAHATLVTTPFTDAQTTALDAGGTVKFGPTGDTMGFSAFNSSDPEEAFFNLSGAGSNKVALDPTTCSGPDGCKLRTYNPGEQVDGTADFQSTGEYKTNGVEIGPQNGNYYFGLDDAGAPDPFGWAEITLNNGVVKLDQFAFEDNTDPAPIPVPEPATLSLFAAGAAAVLAQRRRKRKQAA